MAAGFIGCAGYNAASNVAVITQPIKPRPNEYSFFEKNFIGVDRDMDKRECYRFVYTGLDEKEQQLQSILTVEHCFKEKNDGQGEFSWKRYEDANSDGIVDKVCSQKTTYVGVRQDDGKVDCKDNLNGSKMFYVLMEAVNWTGNPH